MFIQVFTYYKADICFLDEHLILKCYEHFYVMSTHKRERAE